MKYIIFDLHQGKPSRDGRGDLITHTRRASAQEQCDTMNDQDATRETVDRWEVRPMKEYRFFQDPGHGWIAVKRQELAELGLADRISTYSYQRGATVYLEEDRDASLFLAARRQSGVWVEFIESHSERRSQVRSYESYRREES